MTQGIVNGEPPHTSREVLQFLRRPTMRLAPPVPGGRFRTYLSIWATCLGVAWLVGVVASVAAIAVDAENQLANVDGGLLAIMGILFAPLLEEAAFRLPVTGFNPVRLMISIVLITLFLPLSDPAHKLIAGAAALTVLVVWSATAALRRQVAAAWERHFGVVVYGSALLFGLAHATNWSVQWGWLAVALLPLLVAPQMGIGLLLAYARVKLGLIGSILIHAAYNATLIGLAIASGVLKI